MASADSFPDPQTSFHQRLPVPPETALVLSVPHAGIAQTGFEGGLAGGLDVRGDADLFVDRLYGVTPTSVSPEAFPSPFGTAVPHVVALLSRFVCDMNRDPNDVSSAAVPEHPAPRNTHGRGFVWAVTTTGAPVLARPLTLKDWQARRAVHTAYHDAIAQALARARARFGYAVLIDGHSMPSVGRAGHLDPGHPRAEIVPGDRDGTSCATSLSSIVEHHFKSTGYSVSFNDPYKGGFITARHGRPADHVHAIQIEVRRDLYMDEATFTPRPAGFTRLRTALADLLATITHWKPT